MFQLPHTLLRQKVAKLMHDGLVKDLWTNGDNMYTGPDDYVNVCKDAADEQCVG